MSEHPYLLIDVAIPGFEVESLGDYKQLALWLGEATVDMAEKYPGKYIFVNYPVESDV